MKKSDKRFLIALSIMICTAVRPPDGWAVFGCALCVFVACIMIEYDK